MKPHKDITSKSLKHFEGLLERFKYIHQDKYDYSECIYLNSTTKLRIYCKTHNRYFETTSENHLNTESGGCPECRKDIKRLSCKNTITTLEFIKMAKKLYPNYDYSLINYINNTTNVKIICPAHGEVVLSPKTLLAGNGCTKCTQERLGIDKRLGIENFKLEAYKVHKDRYDYSDVTYKDNKTKVNIFCKIHNQFFTQTPSSHLKGANCPICVREANSLKYAKGTLQFIEEATNKFNFKFDYSKVIYKNTHSKITVICPTHGEFHITPADHFSSPLGCPKCSIESRGILTRKNTEHFIEESILIHNNKYNYSHTIYETAKKKVKVICPDHGEFFISPNEHLSKKSGCPECGNLNSRKKYLNRDTTLYYLKIESENKTWYKLGITSNSIKKRFSTESHLNIEVINTKTFDSGKPAYELEQQILKEFNHLITQDSPLIKGGNSEIFDQDIYPNIQHHFI